MGIEIAEVMGTVTYIPVDSMGLHYSFSSSQVWQLIKSGKMDAYVSVQLENYETGDFFQVDLIKLSPTYLNDSKDKIAIRVEAFFESLQLPENEYNLWKKEKLIKETERYVLVDVTLLEHAAQKKEGQTEEHSYSLSVTEDLVTFRFEGRLISMPYRKGADYISYLLKNPNRNISLECLAEEVDKVPVSDDPQKKITNSSADLKTISVTGLRGTRGNDEYLFVAKKLKEITDKIENGEYENDNERLQLEEQEERLQKHKKTLNRKPINLILKATRDRVRKAVKDFSGGLLQKDVGLWTHLNESLQIRESKVTYAPKIPPNWKIQA